MNLTQDRVRSIVWWIVLGVCGAMLLALMLRVNAVKSQVNAAELHIVHTRRQITRLETEYQTRSNLQALEKLNDIEFGYTAPSAGQYVEGERQLAALGAAPGPDAPAPIRYANSMGEELARGDGGGTEGGKGVGPARAGAAILAMVNPVTGATAAALPDGGREDRAPAARTHRDLAQRLARVELAEARDE